MTRRSGKLIALLFVAIGAALAAPQGTATLRAAGAPVVYAAEVDSIIHPVSAEYMIDTMDRADQAGAALVIFTLRTPGGLVDSTREIVTHMLAAKTPVVIFIGPSGARAASAGFLLTIAADVAAMAPGTHIGAAHPVAGNGEKIDETMAKKAAEDVAAYVRTLATSRHRNVMLAEQAVNDSRAFTEREALEAVPPLIDLIASDLSDLVHQLDGRPIARFNGTSVSVSTTGAQVVAIEMSLRQRILSTIANPTVAYLLMSIGMLGLTIELWSPGAILPGIVGGMSLLLAFFALQILPINYAGLLLIILGLALLALEIKVTSYGLLTLGGLASLVFGSMILMDSSVPELQLSLWVVLPVVGGFTAIAALLVQLGVTAMRQSPITGDAGMIDQVAHALTAIGPDTTGRVSVRGEIWQATADQDIPEGAAVRIERVEGLTLTVRRK